MQVSAIVPMAIDHGHCVRAWMSSLAERSKRFEICSSLDIDPLRQYRP
jgi:hypothetical protein